MKESGMMQRKHLLILWLLLFSVQIFAARPECSVCSEAVGNRYMKGAGNRVFCSKKCFEKTLPRCAYCKKLCKQRFVKASGKNYCSKRCAENALLERCGNCGKAVYKGKVFTYADGKSLYCLPCSNKAQCMICYRPEKNIRKQKNGNYICQSCDRDIIENIVDLQKLFIEVRVFLHEKFAFPMDHEIKLEMGYFEQFEDGKLKEHRELGMFQYKGKIVYRAPAGKLKNSRQKAFYRIEDESCKIIVMDSLPRWKAAEVIAHELAHDYMRHRWHFIRDLKLNEGFAEFIAAEYNFLTGHGKWNYRMENSKDPIYGDGYRMFRQWAEHGSWKEIFRRLDQANRQAMPPELSGN